MYVSPLTIPEVACRPDYSSRASIEAMQHPRCVGLGEIGLDYHYDNSPREIQQEVFARQLRLAVRLGKPLTIHTREAEEDSERILKEEVPRDHRVRLPLLERDIEQCGSSCFIYRSIYTATPTRRNGRPECCRIQCLEWAGHYTCRALQRHAVPGQEYGIIECGITRE